MVSRSPLHNELRLLHFITAVLQAAVNPLRRNHYRNVMIDKIFFRNCSKRSATPCDSSDIRWRKNPSSPHNLATITRHLLIVIEIAAARWSRLRPVYTFYPSCVDTVVRTERKPALEFFAALGSSKIKQAAENFQSQKSGTLKKQTEPITNWRAVDRRVNAEAHRTNGDALSVPTVYGTAFIEPRY